MGSRFLHVSKYMFTVTSGASRRYLSFLHEKYIYLAFLMLTRIRVAHLRWPCTFPRKLQEIENKVAYQSCTDFNFFYNSSTWCYIQGVLFFQQRNQLSNFKRFKHLGIYCCRYGFILKSIFNEVSKFWKKCKYLQK